MTGFLALLGLGLLAYTVVSKRVEAGPLTAPLCFTALGAASTLLLPRETGLEEAASWVHVLAEITLVLVLFSDASRISLRGLWREHNLPVRMLLIGLPLTIGLGTLAARGLVPGLGWWEAALLAAILAPTDAALGQAVVTSPALPIRIRQTLNVESGLNDGVAFPAVFFFLCASDAAHLASTSSSFWVFFALRQVLLGPVAGVAVGWVGGRAVTWAQERGFTLPTFEKLSVIGISVLAFACAELIGGNGFIAAFVAGLTLGNTARSISRCLVEFGETEGQLLSLLTFSLFGAWVVPPALANADASSWIYAILSLTILRMLPIAISLLGLGMRPRTFLFLGWFGPRGLASILFFLLVLEEASLPATERLQTVIGLTVLSSIVAHGITAGPFSRWYGASLGRGELEAPSTEHLEVEPMPLRHGN